MLLAIVDLSRSLNSLIRRCYGNISCIKAREVKVSGDCQHPVMYSPLALRCLKITNGNQHKVPYLLYYGTGSTLN